MLKLKDFNSNKYRFRDGVALLLVETSVYSNTQKTYDNRPFHKGIVSLEIVCDTEPMRQTHLQTMREAIKLGFSLDEIIQLFEISRIYSLLTVRTNGYCGEAIDHGRYCGKHFYNLPQWAQEV